MTVYVDDMRARYGRMIMCHMAADSSEELHAMANAIGVARRWCQNRGAPREHYDVCLAARRKAVRLGAVEVSRRALVALLSNRVAGRHVRRRNREEVGRA